MKFIGRDILARNPVLDAVLLDYGDSGIAAYLGGVGAAPYPGLLSGRKGESPRDR